MGITGFDMLKADFDVALRPHAAMPVFLIQELYPFRNGYFALVDNAVELRVRKAKLTVPQAAGCGIWLDRKWVGRHLYRQVCGKA